MANRYWVAATASNWNNTANWSTSSGGSSGASVPGASDTAIFDGNGVGKCTLDINVTVDYLNLTGGYTGAGADDGHFDCDGFDVTITSSSHVAFSNKTVTFSDGTTTVWTFGQGFNARSSSASFVNLSTCTWRFTGSGTFDGIYGKEPHKVLIENGANVLSNWGFRAYNIELSGRLRAKFNSPHIPMSSGTHEFRINSTGVLEFLNSNGKLQTSTGTSSSVLNVYIDGSFDGADRHNITSGLFLTAGTINIYATVPIDCSYHMVTPNNVNGNLHKLHQDTTFNGYFRVDHHWSRTITFDQNNNDVTFAGNVIFFESGKPTAWIPGTGSVILAPTSPVDINFDGKTIGPLFYSDNAVSPATLQANVTTPYVHDCADQIDENGYTVTTTGSDPSPCSTGTRYWVGLVDTDYENAGNWSTSSGGLGNASVPVGSNHVVLDSGSSTNCTMSASRNMRSLTFTSYTGTFSAGSHSVLVTADVNASGSTAILDLGSSSWTVGGVWNLRFISGSSTEGTCSVRLTSLTGANWLWKGSGGTFSNVTVAQNAIVTQGRRLSIQGSYALESGATWNCQSSDLEVHNNASFTLGANSTITTTTGTVELYTDGTGVRTGNATASVGRFKLKNNNTGSLTTIPIATYTDIFQFGQNAASYSGTWRFEGNTVFEGNVDAAMGKATSETIDTATNNASLTFKGDVDITPSQGSITWSAGTGTITLDNTAAQAVNFNGQTVEAIVVSDASTEAITLGANFTTPYIHDCNRLINLNGFTITETGTDPSPCPGGGAFRYLINGFKCPLIGGGLVQ